MAVEVGRQDVQSCKVDYVDVDGVAAEFLSRVHKRNQQDLAWLQAQLPLPKHMEAFRTQLLSRLKADREKVVAASVQWQDRCEHQSTWINLSKLAGDAVFQGLYADALEMLSKWDALPFTIFDPFPDACDSEFPFAVVGPTFEFFRPSTLMQVYKIILIYANVLHRENRRLPVESFLMEMYASVQFCYDMDVPDAVAEHLRGCVLFAEVEPGQALKFLVPNVGYVFGAELKAGEPRCRGLDCSSFTGWATECGRPTTSLCALAWRVLNGKRPAIPEDVRATVALLVEKHEVVDLGKGDLRPGDLVVWKQEPGTGGHVMFVRQTLGDAEFLTLEVTFNLKAIGNHDVGFASRRLPVHCPKDPADGWYGFVLRPLRLDRIGLINDGIVEGSPLASPEMLPPPGDAPSEHGSGHAPSTDLVGEVLGNTQFEVVIPLAVYQFLLQLCRTSVLPATPVLAHEIGIPAAVYGLTIFTTPLARLLANNPCTFWSDEYGRAPVLRWAWGLNMGSILVGGLTTNMAVLATSRALLGFSQGASLVGTANVLSDISVPAERSRTMAFNRGAKFAGQCLGPLCGGLVAARWGARAVFFACLPVMALFGMLTYLIPETLAEEARDSPGSLWEKLQDSATNYGTLMSDTAMQSALLVQFLHAFSCLAMSQNIVPMLCIEHFHMTTFQLAMIYTAGSGATFLASQPSAMIADKYGRKVAVVSGMSVMAATACTFPFLRASWLVNVAYVPYSVAISLAMAGFTPYFADLYDYDAHARSHSLALQRNVLGLGEIVGSPLLGALAASHFGFACGLHSTLLLGSAVCFGLFARETITGTAGGTPRRGTPKVGEVGGVPRSLVSPRGHRSKNGLLYTKSPEAPPQN